MVEAFLSAGPNYNELTTTPGALSLSTGDNNAFDTICLERLDRNGELVWLASFAITGPGDVSVGAVKVGRKAIRTLGVVLAWEIF